MACCKNSCSDCEFFNASPSVYLGAQKAVLLIGTCLAGDLNTSCGLHVHRPTALNAPSGREPGISLSGQCGIINSQAKYGSSEKIKTVLGALFLSISSRNVLRTCCGAFGNSFLPRSPRLALVCSLAYGSPKRV